MKELWQRFEKWMEANASSLLEDLYEGASTWDIKETEEELELKFPEPFKEFIMLHNGAMVANGIIGNWDLYGLDDISEECFDMDEKVEEGDFGSNVRPEDGKVKGQWWNQSWIPFVGSGNGHYLCLDMDPGPDGKPGQVIAYFYDSGERPVLAESFDKWFLDVIERMEKGEISIFYDETLDQWHFDQPGLLNLKES
ncbi:MAG: SMI1/KNR4 family protein [Bacteroidia bacterium]|nr:SMI1/KNR4 family protein [Bacteroidia bacterium]